MLKLFSYKDKKYPKKLLFLSICASVLAVMLIFLSGFDWRTKVYAEFQGKKYSTSAENETEMQQLAENFGIQIGAKAVKIEKIKIPREFNELYEKYNRLQYGIGMDLEPYKGEDCMQYSFEVNDETLLHLIVYNGNFIGGDISEKNFDGFMKGIGE